MTLLGLRSPRGPCIPYGDSPRPGACPASDRDCRGREISVRTNGVGQYEIHYYSDGAPDNAICEVRAVRGYGRNQQTRTAFRQIGGRGLGGTVHSCRCDINFSIPPSVTQK